LHYHLIFGTNLYIIVSISSMPGPCADRTEDKEAKAEGGGRSGHEAHECCANGREDMYL